MFTAMCVCFCFTGSEECIGIDLEEVKTGCWIGEEGAGEDVGGGGVAGGEL